MSSKIRATAFNSGIKRGVYSGRHKLEVKKVLDAPKSNGKHSHKSKIAMDSIEDGKFDENNQDRRGKKSKLQFRGNAPVRWSPQEFKDHGFQEDGGAFKGGKGTVKAGKKKDYRQPLGIASSKNIDPFPVNINKKLKLKV